MTIYEVDIKFAHEGMLYHVQMKQDGQCAVFEGKITPDEKQLLSFVSVKKTLAYLRSKGIPTVMLQPFGLQSWGA
jgi:hypothetical protein